LCDVDPWVRKRLTNLKPALQEYYRVPLVTTVDSTASTGPLTKVLLESGYHHLVMEQSTDAAGKTYIAHTTCWINEDESM